MLFGRNPIEKKLKVFYEIEDRIKKNLSDVLAIMLSLEEILRLWIDVLSRYLRYKEPLLTLFSGKRASPNQRTNKHANMVVTESNKCL